MERNEKSSNHKSRGAAPAYYVLNNSRKPWRTTLLPHSGMSMRLGTYTQSDPQPQYDVQVIPKAGSDIGISLQPLSLADDGSRQVVICHLNNFGDVPYTVVIKRKVLESGQ